MVPLRAPTDCVQYFTGISDTVQNYNFGQQLQAQNYQNCIRTAQGYCKIRWQQSLPYPPIPATTPDTFQIDTQALAAGAGTAIAVGGATAVAGGLAAPANACPALGYIVIPDASPNGVSPLPTTAATGHAFQNTFCNGAFGITGSAVPSALTCKC